MRSSTVFRVLTSGSNRPRRPTKRSLVGQVDEFDDGRFRGWAADRANPKSKLQIEIRVRGVTIAQGEASLPRPDLAAMFKEEISHGFNFYAEIESLDKHDDLEVVMVQRDSGETRAATSPLTIGNSAKAALQRFVYEDDPRSSAFRNLQDVVLIDIQDLLSFFAVHNNVTGIQRVISGFVLSLLSASKERRLKNIQFCILAPSNPVVLVIDADRLFAFTQAAVVGNADQAWLTAQVDSIQSEAFSYRPKRGDTFFISGAYWIVSDFGRRLSRLKTQGVKIGAYIYDLIPITAPQWVTAETRDMVTARAIEVFVLTDFFLTISDFVAKEVRNIVAIEFGHDKPVAPVPLPHLLPVTQSRPGEAIRQEILDLKGFVLCVCTLEGRKNHILLYRVWAALMRHHGADAVPQLVLVGRWGWNIQTFQSALATSDHLNGKITLLNNIGNRELAELYARCLFTVFPSFVEGWGLPVGESLSSGKFCVASNKSSIPEVGGDYVDYFDPDDFFDAFRKIETYVANPYLVEARNKRVASDFTPRNWSDFSTSLLQGIINGSRAVEVTDMYAPLVTVDTLIEINKRVFEELTTVPWPARAAKFMLTKGWLDLEHWGVWASKRKCELLMRVPSLAGVEAVAMLELRFPPPVRTKVIIRISSDDHVTTVCVGDQPVWVLHRCCPSQGGLLKLAVECDRPPVSVDPRGLTFGLSKFCIYENDTTGSEPPHRVLERLGLFARKAG